MLINREELNRLGKFSELKIEKEGHLYRIAVIHEEDHCPYLEDGRCTNYELRPFDCRLYPVIIEETKETNGKIIAFYKFHRRCPQIKFFKSIFTKRDLEKIKEWFREAYPDKEIKLVYRRDGFIKRNFIRLKRIIASIFGRAY